MVPRVANELDAPFAHPKKRDAPVGFDLGFVLFFDLFGQWGVRTPLKGIEFDVLMESRDREVPGLDRTNAKGKGEQEAEPLEAQA